MNNNNNNNNNNNENKPMKTSLAFLDLLAILFIAFKLLGIIDWSWWWVLAPIWIPWGLLLVVLVIMVIYASFN
jgi:membrane protein YdbS with pleckstrin-like domain